LIFQGKKGLVTWLDVYHGRSIIYSKDN